MHPIPGIAMERRRKSRCLRRAMASVLLGIPLSAAAGSVEVLVNPAQAHVSIDRDLLRGIFTMRVREWPGGEPVRVFVLPDDNTISDIFDRESLGTYPYVLRAVWDRMVFTGTGFAPTVVKSEQEMRERVHSTPGAIGYARNDEKSMLQLFLLGATDGFLSGDRHD